MCLFSEYVLDIYHHSQNIIDTFLQTTDRMEVLLIRTYVYVRSCNGAQFNATCTPYTFTQRLPCFVPRLMTADPL